MAPKKNPERASAWAKIKGSRNRGEVLGLLRGLEPLIDEWEYAQAIAACGEIGEADRARAMLGEMRRPSIFCYNACIKALGKDGQWRNALKLLDEMNERDVEPTLHSFSAALSALDKAGHPDRALKLLRKIDAPDGFCYSPCIHALGARSSTATTRIHARRTAQMHPLPLYPLPLMPQSRYLGILVGTAGRADEAMELLEEAIRRRVPKHLGCFNACVVTVRCRLAALLPNELSELSDAIGPSHGAHASLLLPGRCMPSPWTGGWRRQRHCSSG